MWFKRMQSALVCVFSSLVISCDGSDFAKMDVAIDFAYEMGPVTYRASGFLNSFGVDKPADEMISPLKPKLFRVRADDQFLFAPGFYERVTALGARIQATLTAPYVIKYVGYAQGGLDESSNNWPGDNNDWTLWENFVEEVILKAKARKLVVEWDIWNEPDLRTRTYWKRSKEQYFETWTRAVSKIRTIDREAMVVGPSYTNEDIEYLKDFLLYARDRNVLPDVLSWHENGDSSGIQIASRKKYIEKFMYKNNICIKHISINEFGPTEYQFAPGTFVSHFAWLERTKVRSAAKSAWDEPDGGNNCWNYSLDGLLTDTTLQPRAIWWAYKAYADVTGDLIHVFPFNKEYIDGVAGYDDEERTVRAVLGNWSDEDIRNALVSFNSMHKLSPKTRGVHVSVKRIPNSGTEPVDGLETVMCDFCEIVDNQVNVVIPDFKGQEVYVFCLKLDA